jgi:hypothetical protein
MIRELKAYLTEGLAKLDAERFMREFPPFPYQSMTRVFPNPKQGAAYPWMLETVRFGSD